MKLSIATDTLKASVHCAAVKDVRYYLNGVLFDTTAGTSTLRVVSTDGTVLSLFTQALPDHPDPIEIIVPTEIIKQACTLHKKAPMIEFTMDNDRYTLGGIEFTPIDGKYPQYDRVIPGRDVITQENKGTQYNPDLLVRAKKALDNFYGASKKGFNYRLDHNVAGGPGVMHKGEPTALVCIMPVRAEDCEYVGY